MRVLVSYHSWLLETIWKTSVFLHQTRMISSEAMFTSLPSNEIQMLGDQPTSHSARLADKDFLCTFHLVPRSRAKRALALAALAGVAQLPLRRNRGWWRMPVFDQSRASYSIEKSYDVETIHVCFFNPSLELICDSSSCTYYRGAKPSNNNVFCDSDFGPFGHTRHRFRPSFDRGSLKD